MVAWLWSPVPGSRPRIESGVGQPAARQGGYGAQGERPVLFAGAGEDPFVLIEVLEKPELGAEGVGQFGGGWLRDGECADVLFVELASAAVTQPSSGVEGRAFVA